MDGIAAPQQARSRETFTRIRVAVVELLLEKGPDFTLAEVAERASTAIGSIYNRVRSRADLLRVVHAEEMARIETVSRTIARPDREWTGGLPAALRALLEEEVDLIASNGAIIGAFIRVGDTDKVVWDRGSRAWLAWRDDFGEGLRTVAAHQGPRLADELVTWCFELVYSVTTRQHGVGLTSAGEPAEHMTREDLVHWLSRTLQPLIAS